MALTTKIVMRQSQSLVMTPQLLQAIKLLQFSNLELTAYIEEELERNPLLERADDSAEPYGPEPMDTRYDADESGSESAEDFVEAAEADWSSEFPSIDRDGVPASLGPELTIGFDDYRPPAGSEYVVGEDGVGLSATPWSGTAAGTGDGEAANLESYVAAPISLKDHLGTQLALASASATARMIGQVLIDSIDEN